MTGLFEVRYKDEIEYFASKKELRVVDKIRYYRIVPDFSTSIPSKIAQQFAMVAKSNPKFKVEDLDFSTIYEGDDYESCVKEFLKVHPIFDLKSIKHFITELC